MAFQKLFRDNRLMARNVGTGQADYYSSSIKIDPIPDDHTKETRSLDLRTNSPGPWRKSWAINILGWR